MRPTLIPAGEVPPGATRVVVAAPSGRLDDPDCAPVEALYDLGETTGHPRLCVRLALEPGDLDKLAAGGVVWLAFYGGMPMFCVDVKGPGE